MLPSTINIAPMSEEIDFNAFQKVNRVRTIWIQGKRLFHGTSMTEASLVLLNNIVSQSRPAT